MLNQLRRRLSYANVMATIAVFGVLAGGGAYAAQKIGPKDIAKNAVRSKHIKKNQVKGKDVKETSLRGVGLGILGGRWDPLGTGTTGRALSPVGSGVGGNAAPWLAPVRFKVVRFRVQLAQALVAGTRTFQARTGGAPIDLCTIAVGESSCVAPAPVPVPAGARFDFWVLNSGASPDTSATFGWRAVR